MFFLSFEHRKGNCWYCWSIKEAYLDKTDKSGRFVAVTVKFLKKLNKPISLEDIKKNKQLSHLSLIKQSRLSVMPIDSKSWKILNNMGKVWDKIYLCQKKRENQKLKKEEKRYKKDLQRKEKKYKKDLQRKEK